MYYRIDRGGDDCEETMKCRRCGKESPYVPFGYCLKCAKELGANCKTIKSSNKNKRPNE